MDCSDPAEVAVAARVLAGPARLGPVRLVCVDGPAGSGKTTFADALADALAAVGVVDDGGRVSVVTVHLDDLYDGWTGLDDSLWPRLAAQVLEPLRRGCPGRFQRYDWVAGRFAQWVPVPLARVLVLEGCGSARRACDPLATCRVWVEAPDDLRLARGLARDGADSRAHWLEWMSAERVHFAAERTALRADVRLDAWGTMPT